MRERNTSFTMRRMVTIVSTTSIPLKVEAPQRDPDVRHVDGKRQDLEELVAVHVLEGRAVVKAKRELGSTPIRPMCRMPWARAATSGENWSSFEQSRAAPISAMPPKMVCVTVVACVRLWSRFEGTPR